MNIRSAITANRRHCAMQAGLLGLLLAPGSVNAATAMEPMLYSQYSYDSNIYRLSSTEAALVDQPHDSARIQGARLDLNSSYLDYTTTAKADVSQLDYSYHNILDHQNSEYSLGFKGFIGSNWSYGIGWQQTKQLTEFTGETAEFDFQNLTRSNQADLNVAWQFSADWQYQLGLKQQSKSYSHAAYRNWNQDAITVKMSFEYDRSPGWLKPYVSAREERYPDREITPSNILDNRMLSLDLGNEIRVSLTGHSSLYSNIALHMQRLRNKPERNHVGPQFYISYRWEPSSKTDFLLSYTHRDHSVELQQANFVITDGVALEGEWRPAYNLALSVNLSRTLDDYDETTGIRRNDDDTTIEVGARYKLLKYLHASLQLRRQTKDSSNNVYAFNADMMTITLSIQH